MKVVCDSCHARYQIPDERVAGRALRIRCRKCGGKIVVRGDTLEPAPANAAPPAEEAPNDGPEWYISEDGEQQGPLSTSQLTERLNSGNLSWETFLWREGFDDWIPAREAEELVSGAAGPRRSTPPDELHMEEEPTRMFAAALPFKTSPSFKPRTRGSAPPPAPRGGEFAALSARVPPGSAGTEDRKLTATSGDDQVLFSVASLETYARPGQAASAPGHASGEGSGIIDIKALAALASSPPPNAAGVGSARENEILTLGTLAHSAGTFGAIDSLQPPTSGSSSKAVPIAIVAGFAIVAAASFGAILLTRGELAEQAPAAEAAPMAPVAAEPPPAPTAPPPPPAPAAPPPPPAAAPAPVAAAPVPEPTPAAPVAAPAPAAPSPTSASSASAARRPSGGIASPRPSASTAEAPSAPAPSSAADAVAAAVGDAPSAPNPYAPAAAPAAPKPAEPSKPRSVDELLDGAVNKPDPMFASGLPETPSRQEVRTIMQGVEPEVRKCAQGGAIKGTAIVDIGVRGETGAVTRVRVTGIQGPTGSCIALAVRQAKFAPFSKENFNLTYPYKFE